MTIVGIVRLTGRRGRPRDDRVPQITPIEARLLLLRPAPASIVALPRRGDTQARSARQTRHGIPSYVRIALLLVVPVAVVIASTKIDQGGPAASRPDLSASGTGRAPVTVAPGNVTVRVSLRSAAVPWFWCLESSRGLAPEQHLCRDSSSSMVSAPVGEPIVTEGVVHLDAAAVQDASFFVQVYCRDACDWRADAEQGPP